MAKEKTQKTKVPTAVKRMLQNKKQQLLNKAFKSKIKTAVRAFKDSLKNDNADTSKNKLNSIYSLMDKASKKNIFTKNKASRLKSNLNVLLSKKD